MKILITGGGSEEPIDNVRAVCNFSTGRTSAYIADYLSIKGHNTTEILSYKAKNPTYAKKIFYRTFRDLENILKTECQNGNYDCIIHAAAVSDYSPSSIIIDGKEYPVGLYSKIPAGNNIEIKMKKNPKLLDLIKKWTNENSCLIGFKLTSNANEEERYEAVRKIFNQNENPGYIPDYVISNDLREISENFHPCKIFSNNMEIMGTTQNLEELCKKLEEIIQNYPNKERSIWK